MFFSFKQYMKNESLFDFDFNHNLNTFLANLFVDWIIKLKFKIIIFKGEQRTLKIGGSITEWLIPCLNGLDLTKQVKLLLN